MPSPKISTYREIVPLIYSWRTPDVPKYDGWEKIGYTEQESADKRIAQQASQMSITKEKVWARRAVFTSEAGGRFTDRDFHDFLKQQGVKRETTPVRTEWHHLAAAPKSSLQYFNDFAGQDFSDLQADGVDDYVLRPEQQAAVAQAVTAFEDGAEEVLWNAKPRFGKTLTTYDLMRTLDVQKVLIVTNRPAIANSWYDDFTRFIGHRTTFKFVSESPSLETRSPLTREQWRAFSLEHEDQDPRIVEFVSLQDLKGSQYFGGSYPKLKHIADFAWDLLVIDEAHEGIDTTKTDVAFDQIKRTRTLHLSGTPFKALASGKFGKHQIFNWTYEDEQTARQQWTDAAQENPYEELPTLNLLTYQISRMITDRLALGVAVEEDEANIDFTFDLNEFFATKDNGYFEHEAEVKKFLDCLTTNEKYPFSTAELRDEIRHSFWLLNRVASAKALQRLLKNHDVFKDYTVVLAAGDGRSNDDSDLVAVGKALDKVGNAIGDAATSTWNATTNAVSSAWDWTVDNSGTLSAITGGAAIVSYALCGPTAGIGCTVGGALSLTSAGLAGLNAANTCFYKSGATGADCALSAVDLGLSVVGVRIPSKLVFSGKHVSKYRKDLSEGGWNMTFGIGSCAVSEAAYAATGAVATVNSTGCFTSLANPTFAGSK
ncbi:DEAD/DEAH box helicase family protein [Nocardioides sp. REDSEA-S30_B4]|jgi:type II restriction enzyme|uniref:DEAD/DEAH box helicase family protein n=1 Tax=Nocardioides sp. REDSEA-S30_B4 TaxID=1811552 RepID=UPI000AE246A9|nr:DEAD/DEAH box helicase family protein [Nocardioides sp. REDSEA-S30_B4]